MQGALIARTSADGRTQSLACHAKNVAEISVSRSHYPCTSKLIAYLHDLGKASSAFQDYIINGGERVIHAWQGALLADEMFPEDGAAAVLLKEVIGFCVTAHHNHLDDGVTPDGMTNYFDKLSNKEDAKYSLDDVKAKLSKETEAEMQTLFGQAQVEIRGVLARIKEVYRDKNSANFALGLFVKYLFSCLVDADRLDAHLFDIQEAYFNPPIAWDSLISVFEDSISGFSSTTEINRIRQTVSEKCKAAEGKETGIYQLSVPTGGGKTLSSLRFALHHSRKKSKRRIIYVIPYLSILEQTAENLRDILKLPEDNEVIFEHHSNIIEPEDESASEIRKLAASRWDSPIILTTMVQFLESVMSAKSGKLRKLASMADSVIIFDEIQSMPIKAIHCFNEVVTFLSKILNATVILCSATQPTLESTQRANLLLEDPCGLIDCKEDFKDIKRVEVRAESEKDCETAADFILEKAKENGNCLVIVNTKKAALEIYNRLKAEKADFEVLHLSTSMCPSHRIEIIDRMKNSLKENRKVICVSTQLIEAGVDISFSCVVRAMAGLDSIAQAAGRCNRNGESVVPKTVYTFRLIDENLDKLLDIESGREITAQLVRQEAGESDLLEDAIMTAFYRQYFAGKDSRMDYPTPDGETIYAMLSGNDYGKRNYRNRTGRPFAHCIPQAFHSAELRFSVIDQNTKSVVVMFGDAGDLAEAYRKQPAGIFTKEKVKILKKLQKFSVSLYEWQLKKLAEQYALSLLDEETGVIMLSKNYYSSETGVILDANQEDLIT